MESTVGKLCVYACVRARAVCLLARCPPRTRSSPLTCFSYWAYGKIAFKEGLLLLAQKCLKTTDSHGIEDAF